MRGATLKNFPKLVHNFAREMLGNAECCENNKIGT